MGIWADGFRALQPRIRGRMVNFILTKRIFYDDRQYTGCDHRRGQTLVSDVWSLASAASGRGTGVGLGAQRGLGAKAWQYVQRALLHRFRPSDSGDGRTNRRRLGEL